MKKFFFLAFAVSLLIGCDRTPKPLFSTVVYHDSIVRPLIEGSPFTMSSVYNVDYFSSEHNPALADKINAVLLDSLFGHDLARRYNSIPEAGAEFQSLLYDNYVADNAEAVEGEVDEEFSFIYSYEYETVGYTVYESASRLCYCIEQYTYLGGAHGVNTRRFITFSLPDGNVLSQDDLLQGEYREPLHLLMLKKIIEQDDDVVLVREVEEKGYFVQEIYPNDNFYLTDSSMVYVFNPYEIGPYAFGEVEIELPFGELNGYLR